MRDPATSLVDHGAVEFMDRDALIVVRVACVLPIETAAAERLTLNASAQELFDLTFESKLEPFRQLLAQVDAELAYRFGITP